MLTTKTGTIKQSKVQNCPIFTPNKLCNNLIKELRIPVQNQCVEYPILKFFDECFESYFIRFFSGGISLNKRFADVASKKMYLW